MSKYLRGTGGSRGYQQDMNLTDFRQDRDLFSSKASDAVRKLAFAGIAVVWIFRVGEAGSAQVPKGFFIPIIIFMITLALDLLQYAYGAAAWSIFCRLKEGPDVQDDAPLKAPAWINWTTNLFFYAKILAVFVGYILLLLALWKLGSFG